MGACDVTVQPTKGGWDSLILTDSRTSSRAELHPSRGALISRFSVGEEQLLYLDEDTLFDPTKNVRGGIPVLFPIAGKLPGDSYESGGARYSLKQHGFARNLPWRVVEQRGGDAATVVCALSSTAQTLAQFPFPFEATLRFTLRERSLESVFTVRNNASTPMPLHYGLHPYFFVSDAEKGSLAVPSNGTRAFNNRTGAVEPFGGFAFKQEELDLHVLDHGSPGATVSRPPLRSIKLGWDSDFKVMVVWAVPGKDYVCVEPWTAPGGALATGEKLPTVAPGAQRTLSFVIRLLS